MSSAMSESFRELPPPILPSAQRRVLSSDGTILHYDLYRGSGRTLVLVIPGFWRDRSHPSMRRFATFLTDLGAPAAVLDVRGHGDSGGLYGFNLLEHDDVAAVAGDLLQRGEMDRLLLIGFSVGGGIAVSAAARHRMPLTGMLLISPVARFSLIAPRINPFTVHRHIAFSQALRRRPRFNWRFASSPKLNASDDIGKVTVPLSLIHAKDDWLIGSKHSRMLYERANEPKELHVLDIPGGFHADHLFSGAPEQVLALVSDFVRRFAIDDSGREARARDATEEKAFAAAPQE
jgi:alpha-beta hydrolase superfamily lysophospholipase